MKSSSNSSPYKARWYRRQANPEDPWVSLGDYNTDVIHGANGTPGNNAIPKFNGGAKVFIRDSTTNSNSVCLGVSTVKQQTGC